MAIDKLDLCKVIADVLANGQHDAQEVYGMLILLLRLHDKQQDATRHLPASDEPSPNIEQSMLMQPRKMDETTQYEFKRVGITIPVQIANNILPRTKMSSQACDALYLCILDILKPGPLTTRQVATRLGIAFSDKRLRDTIGSHMRFMQRNGYITDVYVNDTTKRNALWQVNK